MKMVKALKGDAINGYFDLPTAGQTRRFDQSNIGDFLKLIPGHMARNILNRVPGKATIVPIPNSHVVATTTPDFKTLALAQSVAAVAPDRLSVVPALVFATPQTKSHKGGPRSPHHFEQVYRITSDIKGQVILLDDVLTLGGHLIGAAWKLQGRGRAIVLGCTFGRTTKEQMPNPIAVQEQELLLSKDFDEFSI